MSIVEAAKNLPALIFYIFHKIRACFLCTSTIGCYAQKNAALAGFTPYKA